MVVKIGKKIECGKILGRAQIGTDIADLSPGKTIL
jgi:hypothetical protein